MRANSAKAILWTGRLETEIDFKELHKTFLAVLFLFFHSLRSKLRPRPGSKPRTHTSTDIERMYIYTILTKNVVPKRLLTATTTTGLREPATKRSTKDERITNSHKTKKKNKNEKLGLQVEDGSTLDLL